MFLDIYSFFVVVCLRKPRKNSTLIGRKNFLFFFPKIFRLKIRTSLLLWIVIGLVCTLLLFYRAEERISKTTTDQNIGSTSLIAGDSNQITGKFSEMNEICDLFSFRVKRDGSDDDVGQEKSVHIN